VGKSIFLKENCKVVEQNQINNQKSVESNCCGQLISVYVWDEVGGNMLSSLSSTQHLYTGCP
jgi:hypothetical protein